MNATRLRDQAVAALDYPLAHDKRVVLRLVGLTLWPLAAASQLVMLPLGLVFLWIRPRYEQKCPRFSRVTTKVARTMHPWAVWGTAIAAVALNLLAPGAGLIASSAFLGLILVSGAKTTAIAFKVRLRQREKRNLQRRVESAANGEPHVIELPTKSMARPEFVTKWQKRLGAPDSPRPVERDLSL